MSIPGRRIVHGTVILFSAFMIGCDGTALAASSGDAPLIPEVRTETITGGGGLTLTVHEAGNPAGPAIVFVHAFSQNSMAWDRQLSGPLAEEFHLIAFDLRGHGSSDKPLDPENYTDSSLWAEDVAAVLRSRDLDRPVLVGSSYAGLIFSDYLRQFGDDELGGLVMVGALTKNGTEEAAGFLTSEALTLFEGVLSPDLRTGIHATRDFVRLLFAEPPTGAAFEIAYGSAMMVPPEVRLGMFSRVLENDDVLSRIQVPTQVIHGADDRIVRLTAAEHSARTIPGAGLTIYEGVGHAPFLEIPARFDRDLAAFVRSTR